MSPDSFPITLRVQHEATRAVDPINAIQRDNVLHHREISTGTQQHIKGFHCSSRCVATCKSTALFFVLTQE